MTTPTGGAQMEKKSMNPLDEIKKRQRMEEEKLKFVL
jgi:hypothetical protein